MLVKLIDIKGNEVWLNPVYVKAITSNRKKGYTEVHCSAFGSWSTSTIKVNASADDVAAALTEAMPGAVPYPAILGDEDDAKRKQQAAVTVTTMR